MNELHLNAAYQVQSLIDHPEDALDLNRWKNLAENLAELFCAPTVMINQANHHGIQVLATNHAKDETNPYEHLEGASIPTTTNIYCHKVVDSQDSLYVNDATTDRRWEDNPEYKKDGFVSYYGLPLQWPDGRVFGTLCVLDHKATQYGDTLRKVLFSYKEIIDYELRLIESNRKLRSLSVIDELTGLFNRRGGMDAGENLVNLASREKKCIGVLFFDMDKLKSINDNYGHRAGDHAIKQFAQNIASVLRRHDVLARIGGDEFFAILMIEHSSEVEKIIKRIHDVNTKNPLTFDDIAIKVSSSIGFSLGQPSTVSDLNQLLSLADNKMYQEKSSKS